MNRGICVEVLYVEMYSGKISMAAQSYQGLADNQTCQLCKVDQAAFFCKCSLPPTLLCLSCSASHQAKNPYIPHLAFPIAVLGTDSNEYMRRFNYLMERKAALRDNLKRMDQFSDEVAKSVNGAIEYLNQYKDWALACVHAEKESALVEIEAAAAEVDECLASGKTLSNALAIAL